MKVSIITPAYNCEDYIRASIDSILNQSYDDWELVIGDDGSTDATKKIIDSYTDNRIKRHHWSKNKGYLQMFNHLLSKASGDFMMSHDADDISSSTRIEAQLMVFQEFPSVGACGANVVFFGAHTEERLNNKNSSSGFVAKDYQNLPFAPATIMYRREVYEAIGGFNPFFDRLSSMDQYWVYLIQEKFSIYYLDAPLYKARMHATSNHRSVEMGNIKKLASWDIYKMLRHQRELTGTDSLEQNDIAAVEGFIKELGNNKRWLAEKYREYSAIRADVGDTRNAMLLGVRAVWEWPWRSINYRTLLYSIRKAMTSL